MKNNKLVAIGDVLIVDCTPQISGRITIIGYEDKLNGLTDDRFVSREYRVSEDGIFWTEWSLLDDESLASSTYVTSNNLTIQIRYTRLGTDVTGEIEFLDINFIGNLQSNEFIAPTISGSIFGPVMGTPEMAELETNIFKKLYYRGVIPQYISRGDNDDAREDRDYIDLFFSVSRYFSMFIRFFKRFENFRTDIDLLKEQIRQYGLYFNEINTSLEDLQYLAEHILDQIRQRGTVMIFKKKGDVLPDGSAVPIDGELVRLIRSKESDELLYENLPLEKIGWCMGKSSPMYRGTSRSNFVNKTPEDSSDFKDFNKYIISSSSPDMTVMIQNIDGKKAMMINSTVAGTNVQGGMGRLDNTQDVSDHMYVVDSRMDYEITFAFQVVSGATTAGSETELLFGVEGFDIAKVKLSDAFITPNSDKISDTFILQNVNIFKFKQWYYVRGIIHAYSSTNTDKIATNLGVGNNLFFNNSFVKYILPKIQVVTNDKVQVAIWDYKIRPLIYGTNILPLKNGYKNSKSLGFIQSSRILFVYMRNNNNSLSEQEITDIIEKYLIPYDATDILIYIGNY